MRRRIVVPGTSPNPVLLRNPLRCLGDRLIRMVVGGTIIVLHRDESAPAQDIPRITWTTISGWSLYEGDAAMLDGTKIVAKEDGKYIFGMNAACQNGARTPYSVRILLNGTTIVAKTVNPFTAGDLNSALFSGNRRALSKGNYIEAQIFHSSVSNTEPMVRTASSDPFFWAMKVGA